MSTSYHSEIEAFMNRVSLKNAHEPEFLQAVQEVAEAVIPFIEQNPKSVSYTHLTLPTKA